jgi:CheY-like chemotaxis protein
VQRILDFSRLVRRAPAASLGATDLRALLARCVRDTRATLAAAGQRLVVEAPRDLGTLVADGELLAAAIRNLLHNASKFSPAGSDVVLRAERAAGTARVHVEDRGPGVAAGEREAIFGAFRRGGAARGGARPRQRPRARDRRGRDAPPSGDRHGRGARGRRFYLHAVAARAGGDGLMRLLVVEDDASIRKSLVDFFAGRGAFVTAVGSAEDAERSLRGERFAAVLLDLLLPGEDGLDLLRRMRRSGDRTPVLIATARGEEGQRIRGLELGADDYVVKPFSLRELEARIAAVVRRAGTQPGPIALGEVEVDLDGHAVVRGASGCTSSRRRRSCWRSSYGTAGARCRARSCCARCGGTTRCRRRARSTRTCSSCARSSGPSTS